MRTARAAPHDYSFPWLAFVHQQDQYLYFRHALMFNSVPRAIFVHAQSYSQQANTRTSKSIAWARAKQWSAHDIFDNAVR
jgi:hypothetical protein